MKNTECVIYIATINGQTYSYTKENDGWIQTSPKGVARQITAEQLLSHLLPPLAGVQELSIKVERR